MIHEILAGGRSNTADEWQTYLKAFHDERPDANEFFTLLYTHAGATSYVVTAQAVAAYEPGNVLELACGDGNLAEELLDRLPTSARYTGIDVSAPEVEIARRRFSRYPRASFAVADARELPFPDRSFDALVTHQFLNFQPELAPILVEAARVLRPGAPFVAAVNRGWLDAAGEVNWTSLHAAAVAELRNRYPALVWPPLMHDARIYRDAGVRDIFSSILAFDSGTFAIEHFTVSAAMTPDRLAAIYNRLYVFASVPDRHTIRAAVAEKARSLVDHDGNVVIEIPFRLIRIRRRGDSVRV